MRGCLSAQGTGRVPAQDSRAAPINVATARRGSPALTWQWGRLPGPAPPVTAQLPPLSQPSHACTHSPHCSPPALCAPGLHQGRHPQAQPPAGVAGHGRQAVAGGGGAQAGPAPDHPHSARALRPHSWHPTPMQPSWRCQAASPGASKPRAGTSSEAWQQRMPPGAGLGLQHSARPCQPSLAPLHQQRVICCNAITTRHWLQQGTLQESRLDGCSPGHGRAQTRVLAACTAASCCMSGGQGGRVWCWLGSACLSHTAPHQWPMQPGQARRGRAPSNNRLAQPAGHCTLTQSLP